MLTELARQRDELLAAPGGGAAADPGDAGAEVPESAGLQHTEQARGGAVEGGSELQDTGEVAAATMIQSGFRGLQVCCRLSCGMQHAHHEHVTPNSGCLHRARCPCQML